MGSRRPIKFNEADCTNIEKRHVNSRQLPRPKPSIPTASATLSWCILMKQVGSNCPVVLFLMVSNLQFLVECLNVNETMKSGQLLSILFHLLYSIHRFCVMQVCNTASLVTQSKTQGNFCSEKTMLFTRSPCSSWVCDVNTV